MHAGQKAGRSPQAHRHDHGARSEEERHRKSEAQQLVDGSVGVAKRGAKIAAEDVGDVPEVLRPERLVQPIPRLEVGAHLFRKGPIEIEGSPRGQAHDEE